MKCTWLLLLLAWDFGPSLYVPHRIAQLPSASKDEASSDKFQFTKALTAQFRDGTKAEDFLVILGTESSGFHKLSLHSSSFYILFLTLGTQREIVTLFSEVGISLWR